MQLNLTRERPQMSSSDSSRSSRSFASSSALATSRNGSPFGHVLWCGPGDANHLESRFHKYSISSQNHGNPGVIMCQPDTLKKTIGETPFVVAVVMVGHSAGVVRETFAQVRSQCYWMGLGCPVYATTASGGEVSRLYDVADVVATSADALTEKLQNKFDASHDLTEVVWCDPAYRSSVMQSKVRELEACGVHVTLCGSEEELLRQTTCSTFAVVVTGRTVGAIRKVREKLCDESTRPLFWIVSLSAQVGACYQAGADAAIVNGNDALVVHKEHILAKNPSDSWMWTVVVGDLKSNILRKGVSGIGGTHWSLPKQFDDLNWLKTGRNYRMFLNKADLLFHQVASHHDILVESVTPLALEGDSWNEHLRKFGAAKRQLPGYVGDGLLFHGTTVQAAQQIMQTGLRTSDSGMYGPGAYAVDVTGIAKAIFFATTVKSSGSESRSDRADVKRGAVIALRCGFSQVCTVPELPGNNWYRSRRPSQSADVVIGTAPTGYGGAKGFWTKKGEDLNNIPEYVISDSAMIMPLFIAVYTK